MEKCAILLDFLDLTRYNASITALHIDKGGLVLKRSAREQMQQKFDFYEVPEFDKAFRGYDTGAVDVYLNALVDAYTEMYKLYIAMKDREAAHGQITA